MAFKYITKPYITDGVQDTVYKTELDGSDSIESKVFWNTSNDPMNVYYDTDEGSPKYKFWANNIAIDVDVTGDDDISINEYDGYASCVKLDESGEITLDVDGLSALGEISSSFVRFNEDTDTYMAFVASDFSNGTPKSFLEFIKLSTPYSVFMDGGKILTLAITYAGDTTESFNHISNTDMFKVEEDVDNGSTTTITINLTQEIYNKISENGITRIKIGLDDNEQTSHYDNIGPNNGVIFE